MKTYPYIGKGVESATVVMMFKPRHGIIIDSKTWVTDTGKIESKINEGYLKNITHEYLQNTYGEVVSARHAGFIIELAKVHDIEVCKPWHKGLFFNFYKKQVGGKIVLFFFHEDKAREEGEKQITIPLPPKVETLKNAGDNLILGCEDSIDNLCDRVAESILKKNPTRSGHEDSKCDEWPKVGERVIHNDTDYYYVCKSPFDGCAVLTLCSTDGWDVISVPYKYLKKPKTPEEELRDDIKQEVFSSFMIMPELLAKRDVVISISECIANELARKYNITKKPQ